MTPTVAIVGAGFGGLAVALELKAAGIESFTVLERADEVGGVWQANTYPGAACDVPSVIYQFSRHLRPDWSRRFGSQQEIRDYLRDVSVESGVREFGLTYPVVLDSEYELWKAFANRYLPAKYLIDRAGFIRFAHFGEGGYVETEQHIQAFAADLLHVAIVFQDGGQRLADVVVIQVVPMQRYQRQPPVERLGHAWCLDQPNRTQALHE